MDARGLEPTAPRRHPAGGDPVVEALHSRDPAVRLKVVQDLRGDARVGLVVSLIDDEDPRVRQAVADALWAVPVDNNMVDTLLRAAASLDADVRVLAARLLSGQTDDSIVDRLVAALTAPDPLIRVAAGRALRCNNNSAVVRALIAAATDGDAAVRRTALQSLVVLRRAPCQNSRPARDLVSC